MARRKIRNSRSSRFVAFKKHYSRNKSSYGMVGTLLGAMAYGAIRAKAATYITPISNNLPLGNISDEVALGGIAFLGDKFLGSKMPILKPLFKGALVVEGSRIGVAIATGTTGIGQASMSNSSSMLG